MDSSLNYFLVADHGFIYRDWMHFSWVGRLFPACLYCTPFKASWSERRSFISLLYKPRTLLQEGRSFRQCEWFFESLLPPTIEFLLLLFYFYKWHQLVRASNSNTGTPFNMLSRRGHAYAESQSLGGYVREKQNMYNKQTNPHGEIGWANAENVRIKVIPSQFICIGS